MCFYILSKAPASCFISACSTNPGLRQLPEGPGVFCPAQRCCQCGRDSSYCRKRGKTVTEVSGSAAMFVYPSPVHEEVKLPTFRRAVSIVWHATEATGTIPRHSRHSHTTSVHIQFLTCIILILHWNIRLKRLNVITGANF